MSARLGRIYGEHMNRESGLFVCDFINNALEHEPITVNGPLNLIRPLTHISDASSAALTILEHGEIANAYNIQSDEITTLGETAKLISKLSGSPLDIKKPETEFLEPTGHYMSCDKLMALGWNPTVKLRDGLQEILNKGNG
jgi:nucleoside-diphosphate-sugar epimerase